MADKLKPAPAVVMDGDEVLFAGFVVSDRDVVEYFRRSDDLELSAMRALVTGARVLTLGRQVLVTAALEAVGETEQRRLLGRAAPGDSAE